MNTCVYIKCDVKSNSFTKNLYPKFNCRIGPKLASEGYDYKAPVINLTDTNNEHLLLHSKKRLISRNIAPNKGKSCFQSPDCDNQVHLKETDIYCVVA